MEVKICNSFVFKLSKAKKIYNEKGVKAWFIKSRSVLFASKALEGF